MAPYPLLMNIFKDFGHRITSNNTHLTGLIKVPFPPLSLRIFPIEPVTRRLPVSLPNSVPTLSCVSGFPTTSLSSLCKLLLTLQQR